MNTFKRIVMEDVIEPGDGAATDARLETEEEINFIITGWNMPDMNGLEFVNKVPGE